MQHAVEITHSYQRHIYPYILVIAPRVPAIYLQPIKIFEGYKVSTWSDEVAKQQMYDNQRLTNQQLVVLVQNDHSIVLFHWPGRLKSC